MKEINPNTAARVWDRVRNTAVPTGDAPTILNLIAEEMQDAAAYQKLSQQLPAPLAAIARQIARQEQSHVACLRGVYTLITGQKPILPPPAVTDDGPQILLRRCYGREMQCLARYEARTADPEFGQVFSRLADQEREHCHLLLEILGRLKTG